MRCKFYVFLVGTLLTFGSELKAETIQIKTEISTFEFTPVEIYMNNISSMCDYNTDYFNSEKYKIPMELRKFTTNQLDSIFLKTKRVENETVFYRFAMNNGTLTFTNGFSYTEDSIKRNILFLIRKENKPKYHSENNKKEIILSLDGYDKIEERIEHNLICPAGIRNINNDYIDVNIESNPIGAQLAVDGKILDFTTNRTIRIPKSSEAITLMVSKDGYIPYIEQISESSKIVVNLSPSSP